MSVQTQLGLGRVGLKKVYFVEAAKVPDEFKDVVGRIDNTTQSFERYRQLAGLGMATQMTEGSKVQFDQLGVLFQSNFTPVLYGKGISFTPQTTFTDQYGVLKNMQPHFARAFKHKKNTVFANLDNLGFTDTTYGMNAETLYSTTHSMGPNVTGSNRPATEVAFSAAALQQMLKEIRKQKSARGTPQPYIGRVLVKLPPDLEPEGFIAIQSLLQSGTANNDANYVKTRVAMTVNDYYTSATAWFARAEDDEAHGLFGLEQMAYDIMKFAFTEDFAHKWGAYESYVVGWYDWHGTWGTQGA